jgi:MFS family permease
MGWFQYQVLFAAGFCFAADAMQVLLFSFLSEILRHVWGLNTNETASIGSVLFAGAMLGTLVLGPLADRIGRHPIFLIASSVIAFFGVSSGLFVTTYGTLLPVVFMIGLGVGGLTVPFDILAEFLPTASRGKYLLLIEYFWTIGTLYVVVMAYLTLGGRAEEGDHVVNWRLFAVLSSLPCSVSIVLGFWLVPESPRWLCTVNRCDEALEIIRNAAKTNGRDVDFLFPRQMTLVAEVEEDSSFMELLAPKWRWTMLKLWGLWAAMSFGYYGILMSTTRIFATKYDGGSVIGGPDEGTTTFDYAAIFMSSSAELVGVTFVMLLVDVTGRIPLQMVSFTMGGISLAGLCFLASHGAPRTILIVLGFTARSFEMASSCVTWVSTAEILPTEIRTTGMLSTYAVVSWEAVDHQCSYTFFFILLSLSWGVGHSSANAVARIASILCPFLVQNTPLVTMGVIMLVIHTFAVLCVSQLPETKGMRMGASSIDSDPIARAIVGVAMTDTITPQHKQHNENVAAPNLLAHDTRELR